MRKLKSYGITEADTTAGIEEVKSLLIKQRMELIKQRMELIRTVML